MNESIENVSNNLIANKSKGGRALERAVREQLIRRSFLDDEKRSDKLKRDNDKCNHEDLAQGVENFNPDAVFKTFVPVVDEIQGAFVKK